MKSDQNHCLITNVNSRSPFAEAFRTLRTNIEFAGLDKPYHSIMLTSAGPGEGKSINVANLGVVMAQSGKRVLIMDCDLRRPVQHKIFNINDSMGVTNLLVNESDPSGVASETGIPNLYVLPSGPIPPNPAELAGSRRMKALIARAREDFDCVLVDAPPVIVVTDAILLSTLVDGVILVLQGGATRIDAAREAKDKLEKAGAKTIGVILNKIDIAGGDYYYNYYHYYHKGDNSRKVKKRKLLSKIALFQFLGMRR